MSEPRVKNVDHGPYHKERVTSHSIDEIRDIKLYNDVINPENGKGCHRRKGANNKSYRNNFDSIFRKSNRKQKK